MSFEYTLASKDEARYSHIQTYFENTGTDMSMMMVTSLTASCCIKVLKVGDYIKIGGVNYYFQSDYTQLNHDTFIGLLNERVIESGVVFGLDYCNRIVVGGENINITDASYNVRLLMGLHPFDEINITTLGYVIGTVGFMLSTPVLYLTSNIGQKCYKNVQQSSGIQSMKIVMRINNSFSANYPINAGNAEFSVQVSTNDLTSVEFILVDANMVEIELLSPMYLSVSIRKIDNDKSLEALRGAGGTLRWIEQQKNKEYQQQMNDYKLLDLISSMKESDVTRWFAQSSE